MTPAMSSREETHEETPNVGACLCAPAWGIGGFSLFVVVRASSGKKLFEHALAKSVPKIHVAPRVSANAPGEEPSLLIGDDRVFVVASNAAGKVRLRQEVVPGEYLRRQWPMRLASMNPEGSHIAIAGARGCVLYDTHRERWGMFRNFEEETRSKPSRSAGLASRLRVPEARRARCWPSSPNTARRECSPKP